MGSIDRSYIFESSKANFGHFCESKSNQNLIHETPKIKINSYWTGLCRFEALYPFDFINSQYQ